MDKLKEIAKRAVEDYGFRQIAQWSPDDLVEQWDLSPDEAQVLKGALGLRGRRGPPQLPHPKCSWVALVAADALTSRGFDRGR
jgi:hypothetical protein